MKITSSGGSFEGPRGWHLRRRLCPRCTLAPENEFEGKKTSKRQLMLGFELHGDAVDSDGCG
jgi:hypothetical protein